LREETGFVATAFDDLGEYATSPGMTSETFRLFRARGLEREGVGGGVDGEDIVVHVVALAGLAAWLEARRGDGAMIDSRLLVALALV
jgi:ADP-ribose pyrophosphatase